MTTLVLCCDGTWSTLPREGAGSAATTNVAKLYACLDADSEQQTAYYHPGLGTSGGPISRITAGAFGRGLSNSIMSAYLWLAENYREADDIVLFGYSRGAYTVRSLAGMLRYCGLLKFSEESHAERWSRVRIAYRRGYRGRAESREAWAGEDYQFHLTEDEPVRIRFMGAWDTVGALGIPNNLALLNLFDTPFGWAFHDTSLGPHVKTARHALALDERRASFTPTLWRDVFDRDVKQIWFIGGHADVGGGAFDARLSNIALRWMIDEANRNGVGFSAEKCAQLEVDPNGAVTDSVRGVFRRLRTRPRAIPILVDESPNVHRSVFERMRSGSSDKLPYRPTRRLSVGESATTDVHARDRWNETGIYLDAGNYAFTSSGTWADDTATLGPEGDEGSGGVFGQRRLRYLLSGLWGNAERAWRAVTGNAAADFWYTRRIENLPWMALVGVIANDNGATNPDNDGSPKPHERFLIGAGTRRLVVKPGYLYAYANDIWARYDTNKGSVRLTVTRI